VLLDPVTVTVYTPALPVQERVEAPGTPRARVEGLRVQVKPVEGDIEDTRVTVPVRPCRAGRAVTVIVDVPATPEFTVMLGMLATTVKSWTV
jgi:hypothetical protein